MGKVKLESILKEGGFSTAEISQIKAGELISGSTASRSDRELAVRLAFLVKAPANQLRDIYLTDPQKKNFDPTVTALALIEKDDVSAFANVKLNDAILHQYLKAAPGSDLNLSKSEIKAFQALKKDKKRVADTFRNILLERYRSYKERGLEGIGPYNRKGGKDYHPSEELKHQIELANILKDVAPAFHNHLIEYPNHRPEGLEDAFFWVNSDLDGLPVVALAHRMGLQVDSENFVFAERYFYVSRSYNSVQGVGGAFSAADDDTVVVYCTRTSTDQVSGFGGATKRAIGSRMMGGKVAENFERARKLAAEKACASK